VISSGTICCCAIGKLPVWGQTN